MSHDVIIYKGKLSHAEKQYTLARMVYNKQKRKAEQFEIPLVVANQGQHLDTVNQEPQKAVEFYFHGYANGLFYRLFNAVKHDNGISGDSGHIVVSQKNTLVALKSAVAMLPTISQHWIDTAKDLSHYIDKQVATAKHSDNFTVIFC